MRFLVPAALLFAATASAEPPVPKPEDVTRLVAQLGSEDFAEREAAARRLEELGTAAIDALRTGAKSDNPETRRRALELLRTAERRAANDKTLAPTLVELDAKDTAVDAVLADLSKQAGCDVVLGGLKPEDVAGKKVTVSTGGKVAFWAAVLKVCDAADLQIGGTGGFLAPGSMPYLGRAKPGVRIARDANRAVVLESRDAKKRPAAVCGAVLVEAVPFPKAAPSDPPSILLQMWPEPGLRWEGLSGSKVLRATDADGARLAAEYAAADDSPRPPRGAVLVRNPDGTATLVRDADVPSAGAFRPNARQAVLRFRPGEKASPAAELEVSVFGTVRSGVEPLCRVRGLEANKPASADGPGGTEMSVAYGPEGGTGLAADVRVGFDPKDVQLAGVSDDLPGVRGGAAGLGNATVHGVRVTDADGKPFVLGLASGLTRLDPANRRTTLSLKLQLHAGKREIGSPDAVTLWGTYPKTVEVRAVLKGVPLSGGK